MSFYIYENNTDKGGYQDLGAEFKGAENKGGGGRKKPFCFFCCLRKCFFCFPCFCFGKHQKPCIEDKKPSPVPCKPQFCYELRNPKFCFDPCNPKVCFDLCKKKPVIGGGVWKDCGPNDGWRASEEWGNLPTWLGAEDEAGYLFDEAEDYADYEDAEGGAGNGHGPKKDK